jgi:hypothetical protein
MNLASMQAVAVAAHAGMFHRVNGRWPGDRAELEHFDCPAIDAETFDKVSFDDSPPGPIRDEHTCGFLADLEYRIELTPGSHELRMTFRDGERLVCKLRVDEPGADSGTALAPMMTIHTSVFSCPGNGESIQ